VVVIVNIDCVFFSFFFLADAGEGREERASAKTLSCHDFATPGQWPPRVRVGVNAEKVPNNLRLSHIVKLYFLFFYLLRIIYGPLCYKIVARCPTGPPRAFGLKKKFSAPKKDFRPQRKKLKKSLNC
jgi:hypothetical protein